MKQIPNIEEESIDIAILNLVFSGLSIAQMDKIPKWLLENMEKNKTKFKETLHQQLQSIHTSLVAAVEGKKYIEPQSQRAINYNRGIDDTLTIINSIFKE